MRYLAFCDELEARGVYAYRYALGHWFVSLAHDDDAITTRSTLPQAPLRRSPGRP